LFIIVIDIVNTFVRSLYFEWENHDKSYQIMVIRLVNLMAFKIVINLVIHDCIINLKNQFFIHFYEEIVYLDCCND
jgi:hypothetical protein